MIKGGCDGWKTLFTSIPEALIPINAWKDDYNRRRPHSALGDITPVEFAMKMALETEAA
tara:strand:+ start:171 stop:347 length:177 start_codon:yes stop_codon:yes gene_type:complete